MPEKKIVGRDAEISFVDYADEVPAKIDTGADSSAVWASDIFVDEDNYLHFKLFGKGSPYYTGKEIIRKDFSVALIKSAFGDVAIRYCVKLSIRINGKRIKVNFGLSDRSTHSYPVLIGRRTLRGKFVVDVAEKTKPTEKMNKVKPRELKKKMKENPYEFYKEYYLKNNGVK